MVARQALVLATSKSIQRFPIERANDLSYILAVVINCAREFPGC